MVGHIRRYSSRVIRLVDGLEETTLTSDSTSEAARERKTRALSVRSELTTLNRKQSLMIRILALIDGHCRAMRVVLLVVQVGSRRMRLTSSAWKDSSFCKRVEFKSMFRHQVVGMVTHSAQRYSWRKGG